MNNERELAKFERKGDVNEAGMVSNQTWARCIDMQDFAGAVRAQNSDSSALQLFGNVQIVADNSTEAPPQSSIDTPMPTTPVETFARPSNGDAPPAKQSADTSPPSFQKRH